MTDTIISLERTNELIHLFGENQKHAMRGEQRSAMRSVLFDLGRRSPLGWRCLYEHQVPFLKEIAAIMEPDEIGRRMRGLGNRPTNLQPFILMCSEFGWRQQMMLDAGLSEGDPFSEDVPADLAYVCDFWARSMGAYRQDGFLLPEQHGGTLRILDAPDLELLDRATADGGTNELAKVRRMAATLELYSFVLHGEQRDGISGHGPYLQADGSTIFVREFSDLRNDYLPWAKTATENPWDAVVIAYRARGVEVKNDVLSTMFVTPHEYADLVEGVSVMAKRDGDPELTPLSADQVAEVTEAAASAQEELYLAALQWDDRYKIAYGAALFANHVWPFAKLAGADRELGDRLMAACQQTADRETDAMLGAEVPNVWTHMATCDGDMYWPVVLAS